MRKRRSTVYVRPGKDVTLYIPTDTPPEVIDYLNSLKEEGVFSQGVMEMITAYVLRRRGDVFASGEESSDVPEVPGASDMFDAIDGPKPSEANVEPEYVPAARKLNMAEIFQQSKRNSGKLADLHHREWEEKL